MNRLPPIRDEGEARAIIAGGLVEAELGFATSITAPLYWIIREGPREFRVRNGSAFFLDTGERLFAVTAHHVVEGLRRDRSERNVVAIQLGLDLCIDLEGKHAIIAADRDLDIATFRITEGEIKSIGKISLLVTNGNGHRVRRSKIAASTTQAMPVIKQIGFRRAKSHLVRFREVVSPAA